MRRDVGAGAGGALVAAAIPAALREALRPYAGPEMVL